MAEICAVAVPIQLATLHLLLHGACSPLLHVLCGVEVASASVWVGHVEGTAGSTTVTLLSPQLPQMGQGLLRHRSPRVTVILGKTQPGCADPCYHQYVCFFLQERRGRCFHLW